MVDKGFNNNNNASPANTEMLAPTVPFMRKGAPMINTFDLEEIDNRESPRFNNPNFQRSFNKGG